MTHSLDNYTPPPPIYLVGSAKMLAAAYWQKCTLLSRARHCNWPWTIETKQCLSQTIMNRTQAIAHGIPAYEIELMTRLDTILLLNGTPINVDSPIQGLLRKHQHNELETRPGSWFWTWTILLSKHKHSNSNCTNQVNWLHALETLDFRTTKLYRNLISVSNDILGFQTQSTKANALSMVGRSAPFVTDYISLGFLKNVLTTGA